MPYPRRRRFGRFRGRFRRSAYFKRRGVYRRGNRRVYRRSGINMRVAGLQLGRNEWKSHEVAAAEDVDLGTTVLWLNGIAAGTDIGERIGRKIVMRKIVANLTMHIKTAVTASAGCRAMLVYDKQANAAAPAVGDVLDLTVGLGDENAPINLQNRSRFVIMRDWKTIVNAEGVTGDSRGKTLVWKGALPVIYSGVGNTIGSINSGSLWLMTVGSQAAGNGAHCSGAIRIRYEDA